MEHVILKLNVQTKEEKQADHVQKVKLAACNRYLFIFAYSMLNFRYYEYFSGYGVCCVCKYIR